MPLYEYENVTTKERADFFRPVHLRDDVPGWRRVPTCPAINPHGLAERPEVDVVKSALNGFKAIESRPGGGDEIRRVMQMTPSQIKDVWNRPQPPAPLPA